jgi:hypothetical protein
MLGNISAPETAQPKAAKLEVLGGTCKDGDITTEIDTLKVVVTGPGDGNLGENAGALIIEVRTIDGNVPSEPVHVMVMCLAGECEFVTGTEDEPSHAYGEAALVTDDDGVATCGVMLLQGDVNGQYGVQVFIGGHEVGALATGRVIEAEEATTHEAPHDEPDASEPVVEEATLPLTTSAEGPQAEPVVATPSGDANDGSDDEEIGDDELDAAFDKALQNIKAAPSTPQALPVELTALAIGPADITAAAASARLPLPTTTVTQVAPFTPAAPPALASVDEVTQIIPVPAPEPVQAPVAKIEPVAEPAVITVAPTSDVVTPVAPKPAPAVTVRQVTAPRTAAKQQTRAAKLSLLKVIGGVAAACTLGIVVLGLASRLHSSPKEAPAAPVATVSAVSSSDQARCQITVTNQNGRSVVLATCLQPTSALKGLAQK